MLALLKNRQGGIVNKFSRDVPFRVPADKLDITRRGNFNTMLFFDAPPGRYTLETAVLDRENMKISTRRAVLMVPPVTPGVKMSSITVIRRMEPAAPDDDPEDPMHFSGGKVTPSLGGEVSGAVSFYFVVYPDPANTRQAATHHSVRQGRTSRGTGATRVVRPPTPTAASPTSPVRRRCPPVQYEIRAQVAQGTSRVEEHAFFTVQ